MVRFKAIGNAPIMKVRSQPIVQQHGRIDIDAQRGRILSFLFHQNNHFRITAFNRFQAVTVFLRKELNFKPTDSLVRTSQHPEPQPPRIPQVDSGSPLRCLHNTAQHLLHPTKVSVHQRIF